MSPAPGERRERREKVDLFLERREESLLMFVKRQPFLFLAIVLIYISFRSRSGVNSSGAAGFAMEISGV